MVLVIISCEYFVLSLCLINSVIVLLVIVWEVKLCVLKCLLIKVINSVLVGIVWLFVDMVLIVWFLLIKWVFNIELSWESIMWIMVVILVIVGWFYDLSSELFCWLVFDNFYVFYLWVGWCFVYLYVEVYNLWFGNGGVWYECVWGKLVL